ncbi:unnamed protein product, partial [marine sediment metagenome]
DQDLLGQNLLEYIKEKQKQHLHQMVIPYIVSYTSKPSGIYDIYVSLNSPRVPVDRYTITGFEIFGMSQMEDIGVLKEDTGYLHTIAPIPYEPEKQAYKFTLDYTSNGPVWNSEKNKPESIVLRAYYQEDPENPDAPKFYSALSHPPIGFTTNPDPEEEGYHSFVDMLFPTQPEAQPILNIEAPPFVSMGQKILLKLRVSNYDGSVSYYLESDSESENVCFIGEVITDLGKATVLIEGKVPGECNLTINAHLNDGSLLIENVTI